jgi:hypothetical protein
MIDEVCSKCGGAGWLWGYELDSPDDDTVNDTMTQYSCDGIVCRKQRGEDIE